MPPATPGRITPGVVNSTYSPRIPARISSTAMSGLASTSKKRVVRLISTSRSSAPARASLRGTPATVTSRPSICASRSVRSGATRSTTPSFSASSAGIATDSRTAFTAHSTLRFRSRAMDSMKAAAKFSAFSAA